MSGRVEGDAFFQREQFPVSEELELLVGGMNWNAQRDLAICTGREKFTLARDVTGPLTNVTWRRFAADCTSRSA